MFTSTDKQTSTKIIKKINDLKPQLNMYSELLSDFQKQLKSVDSSEKFSNLVQEIIDEGNKLHDKIFDSSLNLAPKTRGEILEYLATDKEFSPVLSLLQYPDTFKDKFISTHERISNDELSKQLSGEQLKVARRCISDIKALKPIADLLEEQSQAFRNRMEECTSLNDLEDIEDEIRILDAAMEGVYQSKVTFPSDERTAGVVIKYLENSPHLQLITRRFNLLESLNDDILNSTARIHQNMPLS